MLFLRSWLYICHYLVGLCRFYFQSFRLYFINFFYFLFWLQIVPNCFVSQFVLLGCIDFYFSGIVPQRRLRSVSSPLLYILCLAFTIFFINFVRCSFHQGPDLLNVAFLGIVLFPASNIPFVILSESNCASVSFPTLCSDACSFCICK